MFFSAWLNNNLAKLTEKLKAEKENNPRKQVFVDCFKHNFKSIFFKS